MAATNHGTHSPPTQAQDDLVFLHGEVRAQPTTSAPAGRTSRRIAARAAINAQRRTTKLGAAQTIQDVNPPSTVIRHPGTQTQATAPVFVSAGLILATAGDTVTAGGQHDAAADDDRSSTQRGVVALHGRRVERVEVVALHGSLGHEVMVSPGLGRGLAASRQPAWPIRLGVVRRVRILFGLFAGRRFVVHLDGWSSVLSGPLVFDTHELGRKPGAERTVHRTVPAPADLGYDVYGVPEGSPIEIELRLEAVMDGVLATGTTSARATGECVRCLDEIDEQIVVGLQELYLHEDAAEDELALEDELLDLETVLRDAVVLALPHNPLCGLDCPGLCPECGARLADDPEHTHGEAIDPRWATLSQLADHPVRTADQSVSDNASDDSLE